MQLNTIHPASGSRKKSKRVGRGIGSGLGKTCGRGHKGQHSRSGGYHKIGFEGGQMPLQRRVPKSGFNCQKSRYTAEVRLGELMRLDGTIVTLDLLKSSGLVPYFTKVAKVILSGKIQRAFTLQGLRVTAGAKAAIEAAGGEVIL